MIRLVKLNFLQQNTFANRIFAGLLAFWMSGAIFLLCCGTLKVQAVEINLCPLSKKGHCAKTSAAEKLSLFDAVKDESPAFDCCGFFANFFDKTRKIEKNQQLAEITVKPEIKFPAFAFIKIKSTVFPKYNSPILNQSGTYLKNCVFRI